MPKITFMGAGSTVFVRNVLGDCMCRESLKDSHFALYDIDAERLEESRYILDVLNKNINGGRATITTHLGVKNRKAALRASQINTPVIFPCWPMYAAIDPKIVGINTLKIVSPIPAKGPINPVLIPCTASLASIPPFSSAAISIPRIKPPIIGFVL